MMYDMTAVASLVKGLAAWRRLTRDQCQQQGDKSIRAGASGQRLTAPCGGETVPQKTAIITTLTTSRPLCMPCVSMRAGLSVAEVEATFKAIGELRRDDGRCRACGIVGPVFSVDEPRASRPPPRTADGVQRPMSRRHP